MGTVDWTTDPDSADLLGRVTLVRGGGRELGLKVRGGQRLTSGQLGAFITNVRRGSLADTVAGLCPGLIHV